ncbi:hypothetical protein [Enterococcus sp. DIV1420a]|uniref:hypothetical protein n=1 Tax=Enterococcus sp. DIV1420a TaxID=2774672 RepID=UPI003F262465
MRKLSFLFMIVVSLTFSMLFLNQSNVQAEDSVLLSSDLTELPLTEIKNGLMSVTFNISEDPSQSDWLVKIEVPRYIKITGLPQDGIITGSYTEWDATKGVNYQYLQIHQETKGSISLQIPISMIPYYSTGHIGLNPADEQLYLTTGDVTIGQYSVTVLTADKQVYSSSDSIPAKIVRGTLPESIYVTNSYYANTSSYLWAYANQTWLNSNWLNASGYNYIARESGNIYSGNQPAQLQRLRVYAPPQFHFELANDMPASYRGNIIAMDENEKGAYLEIAADSTNKNIVGSSSIFNYLSLAANASNTIALSSTYQAADLELTYTVFGDERVLTIPSALIVKTYDTDIAKENRWQLTSHSDLSTVFYSVNGNLSSNNYFTVSNPFNGNILPDSHGEGAELTIDFPEEVTGTNWIVESSEAGSTADKTQGKIEKAVAITDKGNELSVTIVNTPGYTNQQSLRASAPADGEKISQLKISFESFYGKSYQLSLYQTGIREANSDKTVEITATLKDQATTVTSKIPIQLKALREQDNLVISHYSNSVYPFWNTKLSARAGTIGSSDLSIYINNNYSYASNPSYMYYQPLHLPENVATITYPYEVQPTNWTFYLTDRNTLGSYGGIQPAVGTLQNVIVYFDDGTKQEFADIKTNSRIAPIIPAGKRVTELQIRMDDLYGKELRIATSNLTMGPSLANGDPFDGSERVITTSVKSEKVGKELSHDATVVLTPEPPKDYRFTPSNTSLAGAIYPDNTFGFRPYLQRSADTRNDKILEDTTTTFSMEYPEGIFPDHWSLDASVKDLVKIASIECFLDDGTSQTYPVTGNAFVLPDLGEKRVVKSVLSFSTIKADFYLTISGKTKSTSKSLPWRKTANFPTEIENLSKKMKNQMTLTGTFTDPTQINDSYINLTNFNGYQYGDGASPSNLNKYFLEQPQNNAETVFNVYYNTSLYSVTVSNNFSYQLNNDSAQYLDGRFSGLAGMSVDYQTFKGDTGSYTVGETGKEAVFHQLAAGDHFTTVTVRYPGAHYINLNQGHIFYLGAKVTRKQLDEAPSHPTDDNVKQITIAGDVKSEAYPNWNLTGFTATNKQLVNFTFKRSMTVTKMTTSTALSLANVYQSESFTITLTPQLTKAVKNVNGYNANVPFGKLTYYVEWKNPDLFLFNGFTGSTADNWDGKMIKGPDGRSWLQITQKNIEMVSNSNYGTSIFTPGKYPYLKDNIQLQVSVIPGGQLGNSTVTGEIYADLSEYLAEKDNYLKKYQVEISAQNLLAEIADGPAKYYQLSTAETSISVLRKNVSGVTILPGKEDVYSKDKLNVSFTKESESLLNGLLTISSTNSSLKNYRVTFLIPKKGEKVNYTDKNNTIQTVTNDISMILTGPLIVLNPDISAQVLYRISGQTEFLSEDKILDWKKVAEVQVDIAELPALSSKNFKIQLQAQREFADQAYDMYLVPNSGYTIQGIKDPIMSVGGLTTYHFEPDTQNPEWLLKIPAALTFTNSQKQLSDQLELVPTDSNVPASGIRQVTINSANGNQLVHARTQEKVPYSLFFKDYIGNEVKINHESTFPAPIGKFDSRQTNGTAISLQGILNEKGHSTGDFTDSLTFSIANVP